ncbi:MFS transporter [Luteolibacter yonseiensis]|uniref:MFS transporter n=1 Tax=Luteolibacter yonseiensis TaxID=1144680 RepID=A0A934VCK0_9BACT|nr:MFS transporter [Luteolibacter yonseiensis]MBK1818423.1 MFS transporter [Luteolibacter yonseiensis]
MNSPSHQNATGSPASNDTLAGLRLATRIAFFVAGMGVACWAPLVPYAKAKLGLDEAGLGMMLLFLGAGSVSAMPVAGGLAGRFGSRAVILGGLTALALVLPLLSVVTTPWQLSVTLALFGASLGAVDVAANIHGVEVEHRAGVPLMSNFHGFYSIGGLTGSGAMTLLLTNGVPPWMATLSASVLGAACVLIAAPRLLATRPEAGTPFFVRPRGVVLLIGCLTFIIFLLEGSLLDWSAVLLKEERGMPESLAGTGFALFSLAMAIGRLTGDRLTARWGGKRMLLHGSILTSAGLVWLILAPGATAALIGFPIIGLGAANLVPVLFSATSRQTVMPKDLAISAISVMGYAGILAGPAAIGFVAGFIGLEGVFGLLAAAVLALAFFSRIGSAVR